MNQPLAPLCLLACLLTAGCGKPPQPTLSLYRAVQVGDLEQLERHLYWGTDLNAPDPQGDLPLHAAARAGQVGIVRELAGHGADPNAPNAAGLTPLDLALANGKIQVAQALVKTGARLDPQAALLALVRAGVFDRDSFDFLIRRGAAPDLPDLQGRAPLHLAVSLGHLLTVKRLLALGAEVNRPDGSGATPLALAERLDPKTPDRADLVQALQQYGARAQIAPAPPP